MRSFAMGMLLMLAGAQSATAAGPKFPYEAIVEADLIYVRSGPGEKYYATGTLKKGDRVTVQRHDPGQWFMVVPPPGSFSWIPAKYVQKTAANRGQVTTNNVVVRVGSSQSDIREVEQRRLSKGDEVAILGEKNLPDANGSAQLWYRIEPPKNEWRWMLGNYLVPVAKPVSADPNADPFDDRVAGNGTPAARKNAGGGSTGAAGTNTGVASSAESYDQGLSNGPADTGTPGKLVERPMVRDQRKRGGDGDAVLQTGPSRSRLQADRAELDRLDAQYQAILDREIAAWDFDEVERGYLKLRAAVSHLNFQHVIDERLASIVSNRKTQADSDEVARLKRETEERDAELAELQRKLDAQLASRSKPRFDGAGIVQHSTSKVPGAPRHVLLAPDGRVLAYLEAKPGVDLEAYVGKPAGVTGSRSYRPELSTDLIIVNQLAPVRLTP